jgi:hypothetical protein
MSLTSWRGAFCGAALTGLAGQRTVSDALVLGTRLFPTPLAGRYGTLPEPHRRSGRPGGSRWGFFPGKECRRGSG